MSHREGSLAAPVRHALGWDEAPFWDEAALGDELARTFDICHGCRRCVNLCGAFPQLFDLVDSGPTGELDGVPRARFAEVVDRCYLCDVCFLTKCPYVPPHEWNIDFPHLMLRAKAVAFRKDGGRWRDRVLASTDRLGSFAGIPIVTEVVNRVNDSAAGRVAAEKVLGVDRRAWRPEYARHTFRSQAVDAPALPVRDGERTPGKVAVYATCFVNYNEPGIGHDLLAVLAHNGITHRVVEKEACCGMPRLELGDLEGVRRQKEINIPVLARLAREGWAIVAAIPSCVLMYRQELPLLFPGDGLLSREFPRPLGKVAYHVPCHGRVQNIGRKTEEVLRWVPGTEVTTIERCSGHAGTWGVKKEFHDAAMKIGRPVFRAVVEAAPDWLASDCQLAGHHIAQGTEAMGATPPLAHPITLLRMAYGLGD